MITLRPEACDPGIQRMIFEELGCSFGIDCEYWMGTEESSTEPFMGMVSDLGKVSRGEANDCIKERVFTQLRSVANAAWFPEGKKELAVEYAELFFTNITPTIPDPYGKGSFYRGTSQRLIEKLCTLTVKGTDIKTRVAAYRLLNQLINPYTRKQFESYKETNPAIKKSLEEFGKQVAGLSIEFPKPTPKALGLKELGRAVLDGAIKRGALLLITLQDRPPTVVEFVSLDNFFFPNFLYATTKDDPRDDPSPQCFEKDQIQEITTTVE